LKERICKPTRQIHIYGQYDKMARTQKQQTLPAQNINTEQDATHTGYEIYVLLKYVLFVLVKQVSFHKYWVTALVRSIMIFWGAHQFCLAQTAFAFSKTQKLSGIKLHLFRALFVKRHITVGEIFSHCLNRTLAIQADWGFVQNLTCLHCLQHSFSELLCNLFYIVYL